MTQYNLFRLDDVCDNMPNYKNIIKFIKLLNKYNIKPLIGVIPTVNDKLIVDKKSKFKIENLKKLIKSNKIDIALHGYDHRYISNKKGILRLNNTSEFSGLSYNAQEKKIKDGLKILKKRLGVTPKYFFAPAHNYDENTLAVLKKYNLINVDGISLYPFEYLGVMHIPQQKNQLNPKLNLFKNGIFVNHFHPMDLIIQKLVEIEEFCKKYTSTLINFEELDNIKIQKNTLDNELFIGYKKVMHNLSKTKYPFVKIKKYGFHNLVFGLIKREILKKEQRKYGFDKWHTTPIELRPYAQACVKEVNNLILKDNLTAVYEIGCGLGEILHNIKAPVKFGYDIDKGVLIYGLKKYKDIKFNCGSFNDIQNKDIDVLITINFIHEIKANDLKKYYNKLTKSNNVKYIIVDSVNYKYRHDFSKILPKKYKLFFQSKEYENKRQVLIYKKTRLI